MAEAGWYDDARVPGQQRYYDGTAWTDHIHNPEAAPPPPSPPAQAPTPRAPEPPRQHQPVSRQEGRADGKAEKAREKAMRPWFKKKRYVIPLALLVVFGIAAAAGGGGDDDKVATAGDTAGDATDDTTADTSGDGSQSSSSDDEADDVTLVSCEANEFGTVEIALKVVNNSSKASTYLIDIGVTDSSGAKVGDGYASTDNVEPGQTANIDGFGTYSDAAVKPITCSVDDVERLAS